MWAIAYMLPLCLWSHFRLWKEPVWPTRNWHLGQVGVLPFSGGVQKLHAPNRCRKLRRQAFMLPIVAGNSVFYRIQPRRTAWHRFLQEQPRTPTSRQRWEHESDQIQEGRVRKFHCCHWHRWPAIHLRLRKECQALPTHLVKSHFQK